jgi:hypothetical protein
VIVDAGGIPLALLLSPATLHDSRLFAPLLDAVPPGRWTEEHHAPDRPPWRRGLRAPG